MSLINIGKNFNKQPIIIIQWLKHSTIRQKKNTKFNTEHLAMNQFSHSKVNTEHFIVGLFSVGVRVFFFCALSLFIHFFFPLKTYSAYQTLWKTKWNVIALLKARNTFIHRDILDWCTLLVLLPFHFWIIIIIENRIYTETYWLRHERTNQIYSVWLCQHKIDNKNHRRNELRTKKKIGIHEWMKY